MNNNQTTRTFKDDRSIWKFILFGLLTFGIYEIWYVYHVIKDINLLCGDEDESIPSFWSYFILSILTLGIYEIYYWLKASDMIRREAVSRKLTVELTPGFIALCLVINLVVKGLGGLVAFSQIFRALNAIAEDYNRKNAYRISSN